MKREIKRSSALVLLIIGCILFAGNSRGQAISQSGYGAGGLGYAVLGSSFLKVDKLNERLVSYGYSPFSKSFFTVGGGGHAIINRLIVGGEGGSMLGESVPDGGRESSLIIGYGLFNIGYSLVSTGNLRLYPMAGIGAVGMEFTIAESSGTVSFNDILETPGRSSILSAGGLLISLSLGADYVINLSNTENERGGPYIGVRAGYNLCPFSSDMSLDDNDVTGAPKMGFGGPFIKVLIGGGAYVK